MVRFGVLPLLAGVTLLLAVCGNILAGAERAATPALPHSIADARARVNAAAVSWPLRFEENVGQVRGLDARDVRYVSRGSAYTLFLTSTEAVLEVGHRAQGGAGTRTSSVVRMRLAGGNQLQTLAGTDKLPGMSNYFIGNDPSQWHTGVANYARVAEKGVYPGIDLVYHGNQGQLEYDFEVAPQADPGKIRLALQGAKGLSIDSQGDLLVKVEGGDLRFRRPVAYQKAEGAERLIPVSYALKGKNQVEFRLAAYDKRQPLVIDPVLSYSTYLGGSSIDAANGIAVAPDGSAFIAGGTFSSDFPTAHPLQANAGGPRDFPQDAFVSKISADGSTLAYSTYLGGSNEDVANAIAVDSFGNAYVTGTTFSPDFPVWPANCINPDCGGDGKCGASYNPSGLIVSNAFVTELNTAGSALVYSTFLGYYEDVQGFGIAVDSDSNAYVTGETTRNFEPTVTITAPATPPPPFPIVNGFEILYDFSGTPVSTTSTEAFITQIYANGTAIGYSSYLGGSYNDAGYGITVDKAFNAYVTGVAYSPDFPTTTNALQTINAGAGDAFLAKVNVAASGAASLVYSTFLGGGGHDQGNGVAVDTSGNAYVAGTTTSIAPLGFAVPATAFQPNCALDSEGVCEGDAFVAKLNPALSGSASLLYFTYLGGSLADSATGIAVDTSGDAYVTGSTVSSNGSLVPFPIAGAVFQKLYGGGNADAFVAELNPTATGLVYSTYLGGSNTDTASGIAIDTSGDAYVAGQTCSLDFPLASPLQPTPGGNCDAFISKIVTGIGAHLVPGGLIFPSTVVGQTSAAQTLTLYNQNSAALTINSITVTGANSADFAQTNTCGSSVAALGSCTISVTFTPTSITPPTRTAQITVSDSGTGSPQVADLTGTAGTAPIVGLSSSSLVFGNQAVGVTSTPLTLTVTNNGTAALTITSVVASSDFAVQTNNCKTPLQVTTPASNCTITVTFTPSTAAESVGSLTLTDNAPNSPQVILLEGTGELLPVVTLSSTSLGFGSQTVNLTSAQQFVGVTNTGTAPLTFGTITASGPFALTNGCTSAVAVGASCVLGVTFTPTAPGLATGSITIPDNATNTPQTIALSGTGVVVPNASLTPTSVTFATSQAVGTTSGAQTVTLTNSGSAPLYISGVAASANFGATNNCGASVAAGASCTINVTFAPTAAGNLYGTLTVTDNNSGAAASTQVVPLAGTGIAPIVSLSQASMTFSTPQTIGIPSTAQTITLTNTGSAALLISPPGIATTGDFSATNTCGASVAAGANCTIAVTFTPTAVGNRYGTLTLTDNNNGTSGSIQTIPLEGSGLGGGVASISPSSLTFNGQTLGTTSALQAVTLTNSGTAIMNGISIALAGINSADFAQSSTCGATLATGASCVISVTFTPTATGLRTASLVITDSAPNSPQSVALTGGGADFGVSINPTSATVVAGIPANLTVTVTSLGYNGSVTITCGGLPKLTTCTASPATVTPSSASAATSSLAINTTRRTSAPPGGLPRPPGPGWMARPGIWLLWGLFLLALGGWAARKNRLRWNWAVLAIAALWLGSFAACGGGGTGAGYVDPTGTPAGVYTVTVTGTSGGLTHSANFTLTVQ